MIKEMYKTKVASARNEDGSGRRGGVYAAVCSAEERKKMNG